MRHAYPLLFALSKLPNCAWSLFSANKSNTCRIFALLSFFGLFSMMYIVQQRVEIFHMWQLHLHTSVSQLHLPTESIHEILWEKTQYFCLMPDVFVMEIVFEKVMPLSLPLLSSGGYATQAADTNPTHLIFPRLRLWLCLGSKKENSLRHCFVFFPINALAKPTTKHPPIQW